MEAYAGCVAGAVMIDEYKQLVEKAGLNDVKITVHNLSVCIDQNTKDPIGRAILDSLDEGSSLQDYVVSIYVEAHK